MRRESEDEGLTMGKRERGGRSSLDISPSILALGNSNIPLVHSSLFQRFPSSTKQQCLFKNAMKNRG